MRTISLGNIDYFAYITYCSTNFVSEFKTTNEMRLRLFMRKIWHVHDKAQAWLCREFQEYSWHESHFIKHHFSEFNIMDKTHFVWEL